MMIPSGGRGARDERAPEGVQVPPDGKIALVDEVPGISPPSFDERFVRDGLESIRRPRKKEAPPFLDHLPVEEFAGLLGVKKGRSLPVVYLDLHVPRQRL